MGSGASNASKGDGAKGEPPPLSDFGGPGGGAAEPKDSTPLVGGASSSSEKPKRKKTIADIKYEEGQALIKDTEDQGSDMNRLIRVLKKLPDDMTSESMKPIIVNKDGAKAPVQHAGWLMATDAMGEWADGYYELCGGYLLYYSNSEDASGKPKTITLFTYVLDNASLLSGGGGIKLDPEFIGETEANAPISITIYSRTKALTYRAKDPAEKLAWMKALDEAMLDLFTPEEVEAKRLAEIELRPMLLTQNSLQFERRNLLMSNLSKAGLIGKIKGPKTVKSGYLNFQRSQFEEQQFYASMMHQEQAEAERWKKYYCMLRDDATLIYGQSTKEMKGRPKGVISLAHVSVQLMYDEIQKTGKMVFSIVTPLRSFVLCAPHQVALEEWLNSFVRVCKPSTDAGGRRASLVRTLGELTKLHVSDLDLMSLLNSGSGVALYTEFIEAEKEKLDPNILQTWSCWQSMQDFKEIADLGEDADVLQAKAKEIVDMYLVPGAPAPLPEEIMGDSTAEVIEAVAKGELPEFNVVNAKCMKYLHSTTFEAVRATEAFKTLASSMAETEPTDAEKGIIDPTKDRLLIFTPQESDEGKSPEESGSKRVKMVGDKMYVTLKTDKENIIGRERKTCQVVLDTDSKVSRQHGKLECQPSGICVFMDLGSSRGSKVNGKTTSGRVTLKVGDRIKVGKTDMLFTILDESGEPIL